MGFPRNSLAPEIVADHLEDRRGRVIVESSEGNRVPRLGALWGGIGEGRPIGRSVSWWGLKANSIERE